MCATLCAVQTIAGYPIVRRLRSREREERVIARGPDGGVLVRRLSEPIPHSVEQGIEAQAAAGERPHIARLRDLAIEPTGSLVVVTDLVTGPRIRDVMAAGPWQLGHAVTLLVPLVRTLSDLHNAGITVGRLDVDSVRLDGSGAPVIVDWSEAIVTPPLPPRLRARDAHYAADSAAVARLAAAIVEVLPEGEGQRLGDVIAEASDDVERSLLEGTALIDRLFSLADPLPLGHYSRREAPSNPVSTPAAPVVTAPRDALSSSREPVIDSAPSGTIVRVSAAVGVPAPLVSALDAAVVGAGSRLRALRERAARLPRRRLLLMALAVAFGIAMTITTVLDGGGTGDAVTLVEDSRGDDRSAGGAQTGTGDPRSPMVESTPVPAAASPASVLDLPDPDDSEWSSIVTALVSEWERCARDGERLCDTALHRDSAVADLRLHRLDAEPLARLAALAESGPEVLIAERMGAAVILEITGTQTTAASLLLMRSEAGWRVRDVLD